ncbi:MarR family winged helix-turn-helix transcriptional regulator [Nonomuraea turcica]|uniref:MarR family winged helix-turn-helix transcriptional regulator n=1 Tax=Nonomuraea sp. G32 TaxID=3067274 RepID=UPI00273CC7E5|nr:MarR family transcriptional regulator [Nonomuraea sp. G32]MDP4508391.1 MarR family transcriptional regulator [Nonomuraea sp. G32]
MNFRQRLIEVTTSMQRDLLPSLTRMYEGDDLRALDRVLLQVLDRDTAPTVKELAALIGRSVSWTSRLVDSLVRRGLAERHEDETDRRVRRIRQSQKGAALLRRSLEIRVDVQMALWNHFTEEEREVVLRSLEIYAEAARRIRDETHPSI